MDNGPLTPLPYDQSDYPFCFQIVHHFHGVNDNSPLQDELNGLILSNHKNYSKVVETDEYKISTLGISIYKYLQNLTVDLQDWANGHSRMTKEELKDMRIKIFEEWPERDKLKQSGWWGTMYQWGKDEEIYAQQLVSFPKNHRKDDHNCQQIQELPLGVETYTPPPGVVVFLEK